MSLQSCVLAKRYGVGVSVWWSRAQSRLGRMRLRRAVGNSDPAEVYRWAKLAQQAFEEVQPARGSSARHF